MPSLAEQYAAAVKQGNKTAGTAGKVVAREAPKAAKTAARTTAVVAKQAAPAVKRVADEAEKGIDQLSQAVDPFGGVREKIGIAIGVGTAVVVLGVGIYAVWRFT